MHMSLPVQEMVSEGVHAILIKVASLGLNASHLGRPLEELMPHLLELEAQYGCNACGEGGEFETLTLDCPAFVHGRIEIEVHGLLDVRNKF